MVYIEVGLISSAAEHFMFRKLVLALLATLPLACGAPPVVPQAGLLEATPESIDFGTVGQAEANKLIAEKTKKGYAEK